MMLVNELTLEELAELLGAVLRLEALDAVLPSFERILKITVRNTTDVTCQQAIPVKYGAFKVDVLDMRPIDDKGISIHIQFKTRKRWWHGLLSDQNRQLVADLRGICSTELADLKLARDVGSPRVERADEHSLSDQILYLYDASTLDFSISPLVIAAEAHHRNCFVSFFFNPACYFRRDSKTRLRSDWREHVFDVSQRIQEDADRLLGIR